MVCFCDGLHPHLRCHRTCALLCGGSKDPSSAMPNLCSGSAIADEGAHCTKNLLPCLSNSERCSICQLHVDRRCLSLDDSSTVSIDGPAPVPLGKLNLLGIHGNLHGFQLLCALVILLEVGPMRSLLPWATLMMMRMRMRRALSQIPGLRNGSLTCG